MDSLTLPPPPGAGATPPARTDQSLAVPWGIADCAGVLVLTAVASVAAAVGVSLVAGLLDARQAIPPVLLPLPLVVLGVVTATWVRVRHGAVNLLLGPAPAGARDWQVGAGIGLAAFLGINLVVGVLVQAAAAAFGIEIAPPQQELRAAAADLSQLPVLLLAAVVVAPVAEELFFRGMLFPAMRRPLGRWGAVVVSAVVFAVAHVLTEGALSTAGVVVLLITPLGAVLALAYDRRGTLATPIAAHMAFNLLTLGVLVAVGSGGLAGPGA